MSLFSLLLFENNSHLKFILSDTAIEPLKLSFDHSGNAILAEIPYS